MSTTSPSTPESTPHRRMAMNRSFTLPAKMATTRRASSTAEIGATEGVETLYIHPNGKIVKFTSVSSSRPGSSYRSANTQQGTLPWATLTEQTLAAGPIQIYRVPGSVSFLHSGSLLHAIMPRSNCWCVDGVSKFAIRVLADTYYRIELPGETPEDFEKVEEFKDTLKKVLFYERTACPFARTFTIELPKEPEVMKRRRKSYGPAKKWKLEKAYSWKPEDGGEPPVSDRDESGSGHGSDEECSSSNDEQPPDDVDSAEAADKIQEMEFITPSRLSVRERAKGLNMRSVTAPPSMPLQSTPPSRLRSTFLPNNGFPEDDVHSKRSISVDREPGTLTTTALRPFQPIPTAMPPSPPDSSASFEYTEHTTASSIPKQEVYNHEQHANTSSTMISSVQASDPIHDRFATAESSAVSADEWDAKPGVPNAKHSEEAGSSSNAGPEFVTTAGAEDLEAEIVACTTGTLLASELAASLPNIDTECNTNLSAVKPNEDSHAAVKSVIDVDPVDPFAQIQARIQARRSIGGTTSFVPSTKSPKRQSSVSTASSSSLSSTRSSASRRSQQQQQQQQQQALATALVKKACSVFLGPPAQLVIIMLRIAARFAKGALPRSFLFESPAGMSKRVPGSFDLDGSDVEDLVLDDDDDLDEWGEDDFGVPLRSPVRLATVHEALTRKLSHESTATVRERRPNTGWDVD